MKKAKIQKDMGLQEFIESSVRAIFGAITNLQDGVDGEKLKGIVCPSIVDSKGKVVTYGNQERYVSRIHFDLEVEAGKEGGAECSTMINVISTRVGGGFKASRMETQNLSFDIDVVYPSIRTKEQIKHMPEPSAY